MTDGTGRPLIDVLDELISCPWLRLRQEYEDGEANLMVMMPDPRPEAPDYWKEEYWPDPALVELVADIAAGRRSVTAVNKDTLKRIAVPTDFWTMYQWEIHRGPPETLREHGAEWVMGKLWLTSKAKRGRPSQSIDSAEGKRLVQEATEKAGRLGLKRDHEVQILRAAGVSRRGTNAALGPKKSGRK